MGNPGSTLILYVFLCASLFCTGAACLERERDPQGNEIPGSSTLERVGGAVAGAGQAADSFVPGVGLLASLFGNLTTAAAAVFSHVRGRRYKEAFIATAEGLNDARKAGKAAAEVFSHVSAAQERRRVRKTARRLVHALESGDA